MITKRMRFAQWQGTKVDAQHSLQSTVELIGNYLKQVPFSHITRDVEGRKGQSTAYNIIKAQTQVRRSILLYCILDIHEALELLSAPQEQALLTSLKDDLEALYISYNNKSTVRAYNILNNLAAFLTIEVNSISNRGKARELYYTLYLSLTFINHSLDNLPRYWRALIALKIDLTKVHLLVKKLVHDIEEHIMKIEVVENSQEQQVEHNENNSNKAAVTPAEHLAVEATLNTNTSPQNSESKTSAQPVQQTIPVPEPSLSLQTIQKYFDERYLAVVISAQSAEQRLAALLELSTIIQSTISDLHKARVKEQDALAQQQHISALLNAFNDNDTQIVGRRYFSQLKDSHSDAFKLLLQLSTNPAKDALLDNMKIQEENAQSKKTKGLYTLSTVFSPFIALSRAFLSEKTQEYINSWTPETLDSEAKKLVKICANELLDDLKQQAHQLQTTQKKILGPLSSNNKLLKSLLMAEPLDGLAKLVQRNSLTQSHEDLASVLVLEEAVPAPNENPVIQNALHQHYLNLMQQDGDEKAKVHSLMHAMNDVVHELNTLIELGIKKNQILEQLVPLQALLKVFQHSQVLTSVINVPTQEILVQLNALNQQIHHTANKVAQENKDVVNYLAQSSVAMLQELVALNTVSHSVEKLILRAVAPVPVVKPLIGGEQNTQDYFNERYSVLVTDKSRPDVERLDCLIECMDEIDNGIETLLATRTLYDLNVTKAQQIRAVIAELSSNKANPLLVKIAQQRFDFLSQQALAMQHKAEDLAVSLAAGNPLLQQLLMHEQPDALRCTLAVNNVFRECIAEYKNLKDTITDLDKIQAGASILEQYITEHNTWWLRLTDFLAQFCSLFKTRAGESMDEAKKLKTQLIDCRTACEQEIKRNMDLMKQNDNWGNELLGDLPDQYQYIQQANDTATETFDSKKTEGLLSKASMFKPVSKSNEAEKDLKDTVGYGEQVTTPRNT